MSEIGEAMQEYNLNATLWFGKYRGMKLKYVPKEYLRWLKTIPKYKQINRSLKRAITFNINN